MPNTYANIADKKFVGGDGVKKLRKENLALMESVVDTVEEALGLKVDGNVRVFYGTCVTAAATQAKSMTIEGLESLEAGDIFYIQFSSGQTYDGAPTMNINELGAIGIRRIGGTNATKGEWVAGQVVQMVYNGTHLVIVDGGIASPTYYGKTKLSSEISDAENLAATPKAVKLAYDIAALVPGFTVAQLKAL